LYQSILELTLVVPDNYTDEETFLDHLQRNPRLQPYEFWSLMADSTVIVQQMASVATFCCCFVAIVQERVPPVTVVSWASLCTVLAWILWDHWMGQEEAEASEAAALEARSEAEDVSSTSSAGSTNEIQGLGLSSSNDPGKKLGYAHNASVASFTSMTSNLSKSADAKLAAGPMQPPDGQPPYVDPASPLSPRNQQRLATAKSALLIYTTLLGLSPILKSLTRSTTSDSIWAISTLLLGMNLAFFDYGSGTGTQYVWSIDYCIT
jgi:phosphatidylinositol glycan class C protein